MITEQKLREEITAEQYFTNLEKRAWESYVKARYLYHLTPTATGKEFDKLRQIESDGLLGSYLEDTQKAIWFFTDKAWAGRVADSIGVRDFALFRIKKRAIPRDLIRWDNVAEFCAAVSFYALLDKIEPEHITFVNFYRWIK